MFAHFANVKTICQSFEALQASVSVKMAFRNRKTLKMVKIYFFYKPVCSLDSLVYCQIDNNFILARVLVEHCPIQQTACYKSRQFGGRLSDRVRRNVWRRKCGRKTNWPFATLKNFESSGFRVELRKTIQKVRFVSLFLVEWRIIIDDIIWPIHQISRNRRP